MIRLRQRLAQRWLENSLGKSLFWNWLLTATSKLYSIAASLHRTCYERGWRHSRSLSCVVVSVGNLVVGGAGKTPLSIAVAHTLEENGQRVAIASRGYGRRDEGSIKIVSDGQNVKTDVYNSGDEPWLIARKLPKVPVLVGQDRGLVGLRSIADFQTQVLVLDDGFQHHRLARDLDLVVIDAIAGFGNRRTLPRGPLREPVSALRKADGIVVVGKRLSVEDQQIVDAVSRAVCFQAQRTPFGLWLLDAERDVNRLDYLRGRDVGILCGIASPEGFQSTVTSLGARIIARRFFSDHYNYESRDLLGIGEIAKVWVTTEKDAVKIFPEWINDAELWVLGVDLIFDDPDTFKRWLTENVERISRSKSDRNDGNVDRVS